jgi:hypothetical protein
MHNLEDVEKIGPTVKRLRIERGMNQLDVRKGSPFTIEVPYRRSDYISAYVRWADGASGMTKIQVDCRTVDERTAHVVMWKVPRSWKGGIPPKHWGKCHHNSAM